MNKYKSLQKYFGFNSFKEGQEAIIDGILNGKDAIGVMPTGGGKSLCYQLPATLLSGLTIVISPLISLMKDQVDSLDEIGIPSTFINSSLSEEELNKRLDGILVDEYKIVYIAPERLETFLFTSIISEVKVSMIAVDEAHCISKWGHDFRPSYTKIPNFINSFDIRPIVSAFTATATYEVIREIKNILQLNSPIESIIGFDRPNLYYEVITVQNKISYINNFIKNKYQNDSGIIYCSTRKSVEFVYKKLSNLGYKIKPYHGGMQTKERNKNQNDFLLDKVQIIVATNAFGMGIDKPDVRFVIHYNMPQNMESYYQEAGRAGRDGEPSHCLLIYSPGDIVQQKILIQNQTMDKDRENLLNNNLKYLVNYCNSQKCLRTQILSYFGEESNDCNFCGNCNVDSKLIDITEESKSVISAIFESKQRYGLNMIVLILRGSKDKRLLTNRLDKLESYSILKSYSQDTVREIIMTLISKNYIKQTTSKYPILKLTKTSKDILNGSDKVEYQENLLFKNRNKSKLKIKNRNININIDYDVELFEELRKLRKQIARRKGIPPFMVFHDSSLKEMSELFPVTQNEFLSIKGVGEKKLNTYGEEFINFIIGYQYEKRKNKTINKIKQNSKNSNMSKSSPNYTKNEISKNYKETYNLYSLGITFDEIAKRRNLNKTTIIEHLNYCQDAGLNINWKSHIHPFVEHYIIDCIEKYGFNNFEKYIDNNISKEDIQITLIKNPSLLK